MMRSRRAGRVGFSSRAWAIFSKTSNSLGCMPPGTSGGGAGETSNLVRLRAGPMKGLRGDEIDVLGRDVPRCVGAGGAMLDDEAEVVEQDNLAYPTVARSVATTAQCTEIVQYD